MWSRVIRPSTCRKGLVYVYHCHSKLVPMSRIWTLYHKQVIVCMILIVHMQEYEQTECDFGEEAARPLKSGHLSKSVHIHYSENPLFSHACMIFSVCPCLNMTFELLNNYSGLIVSWLSFNFESTSQTT